MQWQKKSTGESHPGAGVRLCVHRNLRKRGVRSGHKPVTHAHRDVLFAGTNQHVRNLNRDRLAKHNRVHRVRKHCTLGDISTNNTGDLAGSVGNVREGVGGEVSAVNDGLCVDGVHDVFLLERCREQDVFSLLMTFNHRWLSLCNLWEFLLVKVRFRAFPRGATMVLWRGRERCLWRVYRRWVRDVRIRGRTRERVRGRGVCAYAGGVQACNGACSRPWCVGAL